MEFDLSQLRALEAAVSHGTFEAAARMLHVTPSAISQRLRALEEQTGRVLLVRSKPIRPTPAGETVLRLARQIALLTTETGAALGDASAGAGAVRPVTLTVAVNADSLATWVLPALAPLAGELCFHLRREDEGRTSDLLRSGEVIAAISSDADPVPGCTVRPLGSMRYAPVATQAFTTRWFPDGATDEALRRAPVVVFDREDPLQHRWLERELGERVDPPSHMIPASTEFASAVRAGMGWGMLPATQSGAPDELVELRPGATLEVPLFWQAARLRTPALDRLTDAVLTAAVGALYR
ncbi:MAG: LysR family transcriptional regulator ArgP [Patulibacter minatonensis]